MTATLRVITILNALIYFGAATYHSGVLVATGASAPAAIAESLLGLVLVAALAGLISPRLAYGVVLAGTLLGVSIIVARGLFGVDLLIHVVMLAGLGMAFAHLFLARRATRST